MFYRQLQEAARLNFTGASLLASNDAGNAVKALKAALQIMQNLTMTPEADDHAIRFHKEQVCSAIELPQMCDSFYVFNKALIFNVTEEVDLGFYNAVIMFNMALAFHQHGLAFGQDNKLRKAIHIYGLCSKLLDGDKTASSASLLMAAINNQAQVHYALSEYENARQVLDQLKACAEDAVATMDTETTNESSPFQPQDMDEFFLNIAITQPPTAAPMA